MATKDIKTSKKKKKTVKPYLTKRILVRAARRGVRIAAAETMEVMGYTVIAHNGWVVKKYADGTIKKLSKIEHQQRPKRIHLD